MIRVVIADEHKVFSKALYKILSSNALVQVVCVCAASYAPAVAQTEHPDIVFLDCSSLPAAAAIDMVKKIVSNSKTKVIALSPYLHPLYASNLLNAGARGYLTKNSPIAEVLQAVKQVAAGQAYLCNESIPALEATTLSVTTNIKPTTGVRATTRGLLHSIENHWHQILKFAN